MMKIESVIIAKYYMFEGDRNIKQSHRSKKTGTNIYDLYHIPAFNPFSVGTEFRDKKLTSINVRF